MENPLYYIFYSHFTINIPIWLVVTLVTILCWLIYWYQTNKLSINGSPRFAEITYNSFRVEWDRPTCPYPIPIYYQVVLRKPLDPETWKSFNTTDDTTSLTIPNLPINTKFVVRVCACTNIEKGPLCEESSEIRTKNLAFKIKDVSTPRKEPRSASIPVYDVPNQFQQNQLLKTRIIKIGEEPTDKSHYNQARKGVLFVSIPHSGKTTLLQGIMNFIFGVENNDDFRLGLKSEMTNKSDEYKDWATVYEFVEYEGGRLGIPLTVIDIPRLQDQQKEHMKKIYAQLEYIVSSYEQSIDCICFVAPANNISLNNEEVDFIQSVMYLFQTDSSRDMCCFYTFADAGPAHVKNVLESQDGRFSKSHFVNWSAFFQKPCELSCPFWNLNVYNLIEFFDQLKTSNPKTLRSSLEGKPPPPEKREELKSDIAVLQPEVSEDISNVVQMQSIVENYTVNKDKIESTGDFSFTIEEIRQTKQDLEPGIHVTNCMQCFFTCHKSCKIPDDDGKIRCSSMLDGYCTVCTGHCIWSVHKNTPHTYHYTSVQVTKSYKEMKTKYEKERGITLDYEAYLEHLNKEIEVLLERIHDKIKRITECKNELQGIERSPLAKTSETTIDELIDAEEKTRARGFEKRIKMFCELKKHINLVRIQQ